ncbi:hypothetical protein I4U23_024482 [Adineta vaga]|nr:hypothetical protein I4U23_024482 [Adineta vaga]
MYRYRWWCHIIISIYTKTCKWYGLYMSYDSLNGQDNSRRQSDAPSKDVLELRDACIRRGIIKPETSTATVSTANEQEYEVKIVEESTNDTSTINVMNKEEQVESQTTTNVANNEKQIESQTTDE